jgi:hypothetical protein
MVGTIGWIVIFALFFAWQGMAQVSDSDSWPSLSHILRRVTHHPAGRWTLFAAWLWTGWHLFAKGWRHFVQS